MNKKGMELEALGWWIIGIVVLVVLIIGFVILRGKGIGAIDFLKNLFRYGS